MSDPNFTSVLDQTFDQEFTRPSAAPTGIAMFTVVGMPARKEVTTKDGDKEVIEISMKAMSYRQTDDPAQSSYDLTGLKPFRYTVWFNKPATPEDMFAWQQLCKNVFRMEVKGKNVKMLAAELNGKVCLGKIGQKPAQDRITNEMYMENTLGSLAPA